MHSPTTAPGPHRTRAETVSRLAVLLWALSLIALPGGCKSNGQLTIQLDLPSNHDVLSPMADTRLSSFSLVVRSETGEVEKISTVPLDSSSGTLAITGSLSVGEVPVGLAGTLSLIGYSATNQVLAYGEVGPLDISATGEQAVVLALRKPLTYISGGPEILVFDTSRSHANDLIPAVTLDGTGQASTAVATTPDGRYILAAVADRSPTAPTGAPPKLIIFNTSTHLESRSVILTHRPEYLSVSPDGQWAVISSTADNWVTIVDLHYLLAGGNPADATKEVVFASPKRAAFVKGAGGESLAVILRDQMEIDALCDPAPLPSTLSVFDLTTGTLLNTTVLFSGARDIASRPGDKRIFIAQPCLGRIAAFNAHTYEETLLINVQVPTSLIIKDSTLWVGSADLSPDGGTTAARIAISAVDLTTMTLTKPIDTPYLSEGYVVKTDDQESSALILSAKPRTVRVYHLSVPPGSTRISALVYANYYGDYRSAPIDLTVPIIEQVEIYSAAYVGLDTTTGEIRRRFRGFCIARLNLLDTPLYYCTELESHESPPNGNEFLPSGATSLYGVP